MGSVDEKLTSGSVADSYVAASDPTAGQRTVYHLAFWHVYILIAYLAMWFGPTEKKPLFIDVYLHQALGISLIYIEALYILPRWYRSKRYVQLVFIHLFFFAVYSLVRIGLNQALTLLSATVTFSEANLGNVWLIGLYVWWLYTALGVGYYFTRDSIAKKDQIIQLELLRFETGLEAANIRSRNQTLERDKARAELAHLRAQINPHFLFNTLNFFYETARQSSKELAQAIMMLSEMMQYTIGQLSEQRTVPLSSELFYLNNYIALQKLRFDNKLCIDMWFSDELMNEDCQFLPLVLITFVENAFKYGDIHDPANPLLIRADSVDGHFTFFCSNKIRWSKLTEKSSGIGLTNVLERIRNEYDSDCYSLTVTKTEDKFTVHFTFDLAHA